MSTETRMSLVDFLKRGLRHRVCGFIGDNLAFEDEKTGEMNRYARIEGFGRTYNLTLESDEELTHYKSLTGSPARIEGKLGRRRNTSFLTAKVDKIILPGTPGWVDLTEDEIKIGMIFDGIGIITAKTFNEHKGKPYRKLQLGVMGETFLFDGIDPDLFGAMPETGVLKVDGSAVTKIVSGEKGKLSDMVGILHAAKAVTAPGLTGRERQTTESKTA